MDSQERSTTLSVAAVVTFWIALAVLVGNDHWLKGAGIVPAWLTGKLSDFAGLVVAPMLLVVVLRARSRRARAACIALVAAPFACFELFPSWAQALESLHVGGVRLRMWPDLTDLLALTILPLTWWLVMRNAGSRSRSTPLTLGRPMQHRLGIAVGALACVATSSDAPPPPIAPFILNETRAPITVTVRLYLGDVACITGGDGDSSLDAGTDQAISDPLEGTEPLRASDFGAPLTQNIEPAERMPLGYSEIDCGVYWVSAPYLEDLIFKFERIGLPHDHEAEYDHGHNHDHENSLILEGTVRGLRAYAEPRVTILDVPAPESGAP